MFETSCVHDGCPFPPLPRRWAATGTKRTAAVSLATLVVRTVKMLTAVFMKHWPGNLKGLHARSTAYSRSEGLHYGGEYGKGRWRGCLLIHRRRRRRRKGLRGGGGVSVGVVVVSARGSTHGHPRDGRSSSFSSSTLLLLLLLQSLGGGHRRVVAGERVTGGASLRHRAVLCCYDVRR